MENKVMEKHFAGWTNVIDVCCQHDISNGDHPASTGGIHRRQLRGRPGHYQDRIVQINQSFVCVGPARDITDAEAARLWGSRDR